MSYFIQPGRTLDVIAPYTVLEGAGVQVGSKFGVASVNTASGASVAIVVEGVVTLAKDTSAFTDGAPVFWDNVNFVATSGGGNSNIVIGVTNLNNPDGTVAPGGASGDPTVAVRLNGAFGDGVGYNRTVSLTAAQLISMGTTPVNIIPAPPTGTVILVDSILFEMTTTSTAFTGGTAVSFVYHGGSVAVHAGSIPAATITAAAGTTNTLLGPAVLANGTVVPAATGVDIQPASTAFAAGTGTAKVQIKYRQVTL